MAAQTVIKHRRDTAANWTSVNPVLAAGEIGFETDTGKFKIGDGTSTWTALTYATDGSKLTGTINASTVTNGVYTTTTSLPNVTSVNSTTIPTSANLLTDASTIAVAKGGTGATATTGTAGSNVLSISPALTGTPTVPTAAVDTNTTQIASTAFVLGQAGTATPVVSGTAAAGTSTLYSRQDHVHPTDTSRASAASPTLSGTVTLSGLTTGVVHAGSGGVLTSSTIVDADVSASAAIAATKISGTAAVLGSANAFTVGGHTITNLVSTPTIIPLSLTGATAQTAHLVSLINSSGTTLGGRNAVAQIFTGSTTPITSIVGGAPIGTNYGVSGGFGSPTATTFQISLSTATNLAIGDIVTVAGFTYSGSSNPNGTFVLTGVGSAPNYVQYTLATNPTILSFASGAVFAPAQASVTARSAGTKGLIIKAAASQSAFLQEWQNASGTSLAYITSGGTLVAGLQLNAGYAGEVVIGPLNSGGSIKMVRQTASNTNPGANSAVLYFRDGTTTGTLKLVVRAGAAGAETTILDNIPQ